MKLSNEIPSTSYKRRARSSYLMIPLLLFGAASASDNLSTNTVNLSSYDQRIINGTAVAFGTYPWMVSLQDSTGHYCGGTLIDANTIITAAHCFPPEYPFTTDQVAYAGFVDQTKLSEAFKFKLLSIKMHPNYLWLNGARNDIAILKCQLVQGNAANLPVGMVEYDNGTFYSLPGTRLQVAGWGATVSGDRSTKSPVLLETRVMVQAQSACSAKLIQFSPSHNLSSTSICGFSPNTDSCQGDSGGPMFARKPDGKFVLVGIVSYGVGCAIGDYPGVYARVSTLTSWILNVNPLITSLTTTTTKATVTSAAKKK